MRFVVTATSRADGEVAEWVVDAADEAAAAADADRRGFDVRFVSPIDPMYPPPPPPPGPSPLEWQKARLGDRRASAQLFLAAGGVVTVLGVAATAYAYRLAVESRMGSFTVYWGVVAVGVLLMIVGAARLPLR